MCSKKTIVIFTGTKANGGLAYFSRVTAAELNKHVALHLYFIHKNGSLAARTWIFMLSLIKICAFQISCFLFKRSKVIIHVNSANRGSFIRSSMIVLLTSFLKKRTIFHIHVTELIDFIDEIMKSGRFGKWLIKSVFRKVDHFIFVSKAVFIPFESRMNQSGIYIRERSSVIYGGIEPRSIDVCTEKYHEPMLKILFAAGRLVDEKNPQLAIALAKNLRKHTKSFHISVTGNGPLFDSLNQTTSSEDLSDLVQIHGWLDQEDYDALLAESHILMAPSQREGMGYCILEGYIGGLAVLANRTGGIPEILKHDVNGYLINKNEVEQYVKRILSLQADREKMAQIGIHNMKHVSTFNIENTIDDYLNLYGKTA